MKLWWSTEPLSNSDSDLSWWSAKAATKLAWLDSGQEALRQRHKSSARTKSHTHTRTLKQRLWYHYFLQLRLMNLCIVLLGRVLGGNKNVLGKYGRSWVCLCNQGVCGTGNTQRFWLWTIIFSTLFGLSMFPLLLATSPQHPQEHLFRRNRWGRCT